MVATRDIGLAAARLLASGGSGKRIIHLAGPREYSPLDVAAALGSIVGEPVVAQQLPEDAMVPALLATGMSPELSRLFQELIHGMNFKVLRGVGSSSAHSAVSVSKDYEYRTDTSEAIVHDDHDRRHAVPTGDWGSLNTLSDHPQILLGSRLLRLHLDRQHAVLGGR
jgi:hypothetical protein